MYEYADVQAIFIENKFKKKNIFFVQKYFKTKM